MKFNELDEQLRIYETAHDLTVLPNIYIVARIDGRGFTRLTKRDKHQFTAPFDERFRDIMIETCKHLMQCGFRVIYAYTQSDEISLLMHPKIDVFGRKIRKYNSILAGEASAKFSLLLGDLAAFDCRLCQLPTTKIVVDYFRWRNEDAHRNALNAHCYWALRKQGIEANKATNQLAHLSIADKNELLFKEANINFNELPNWQKRGIGLYFETVEKTGENPITQEQTVTTRRQINVDMQLPMKDAYSEFIHTLLENS